MMEVRYLGRTTKHERSYAVGKQGAVVVEVDEEAWTYRCSYCTLDCDHVLSVMEARSEFETADRKMGDATP